jgi:hypothetical protein
MLNRGLYWQCQELEVYMSWWVSLEDQDGNTLEVESHSEGATYAIGGTPEATMSVTYNYSKYFYQYLNPDEGLRWLNGKTALDTAVQLAAAVRMLGDERSSDYWAATPGNAGHVLSILATWALEHPHGIWRVN